MALPRVVLHGVDTCVINAYYTVDGIPVKRDLPESLATSLAEWKRAAQEAGSPYISPWSFRGVPFLVQPGGAGRGQWQWMLKTPLVTLYISSGRWNGIASVRLGSEYLWSCSEGGLLQALYEVDACLSFIFGESLYLQPSAVDLCADIANWQDLPGLDRRRHFVSRSRKRGDYHESEELPWPTGMKLGGFSYGLQETGLHFSHRGVMSATIYDKTREMRTSGKRWFADLWRLLSGWQEETESPVWRVEMKFKRQALHELKRGDLFHGIENAYDLPDLLPVLWAYAVGHVEGGADGLPDGWLRCVLPGSDTNRARWPTHPAWCAVQSAFTNPCALPEHFGKIVRQRKEEHNITKGLEAIMGYASSLSAWKGGELAQAEADFSLFLHWLAEAGPALYDRRQKEFAEEVQRKVALLGREAGVS